MKFKEIIDTIDELEDYPVEIKLSSWEVKVVSYVDWEKGSLQLLQHHLWERDEVTALFPLEYFCEFYEEWKNEPDGHHTTIAFLDRYNREWWVISRK